VFGRRRDPYRVIQPLDANGFQRLLNEVGSAAATMPVQFAQ
jgi:hypothetical protein